MGTLKIKIAENRQEREMAFRLIYSAYHRTKLIDANPFEMRVTKYHLCPTTDIYLALDGEELIYTITLIRDSMLGFPADAIFHKEIQYLRSSGRRLAEGSCIAGAKNSKYGVKEYIKMCSLLFQSARYKSSSFPPHEEVDTILGVFHPHHAKFYERVLGFEILGEPKKYPMVDNHLGVFCTHDFHSLVNKDPYPAWNQIYNPQYTNNEMKHCPMSPSEIIYFGNMIDKIPLVNIIPEEIIPQI